MSKRQKYGVAMVVLALQVVAIYAYFSVETGRRAPVLSTTPPRWVQGKVASFKVMERDREERELIASERPVLVHFWATWCAPCIEELPLVLALSDAAFEVVAVSLDPSWSAIDVFLEGSGAERVVRADAADAESSWEISSLPQTVLVAPGGRWLLRANGARDWSDPAFVEAWTSAARESRVRAADD